MLLKLLFPCIQVFRLTKSNKLGMDKVFYYSRMTNISIINSSYDIDNKELFPVSSSSYLKVCSSSDSDTEEEENIDTDDTESIDSYRLVILSSLLCTVWHKIQIHTNTDFSVTRWMLCIILHNFRYSKYHSDSDYRKHVNNVIKTLFCGLS